MNRHNGIIDHDAAIAAELAEWRNGTRVLIGGKVIHQNSCPFHQYDPRTKKCVHCGKINPTFAAVLAIDNRDGDVNTVTVEPEWKPEVGQWVQYDHNDRGRCVFQVEDVNTYQTYGDWAGTGEDGQWVTRDRVRPWHPEPGDRIQWKFAGCTITATVAPWEGASEHLTSKTHLPVRADNCENTVFLPLDEHKSDLRPATHPANPSNPITYATPRPNSAPCPDCGGSGVYVGLAKVEPCGACGGQ